MYFKKKKKQFLKTKMETQKRHRDVIYVRRKFRKYFVDACHDELKILKKKI